MQSHAALGVCVIGEPSQAQFSFARLQVIDLAEVVEFSDSDDLKLTFEDQFIKPFNTTASVPLWRVVVLKNNIVCFAWHHCIGDGLSGLAFHRTLLAALHEPEVIDDRAEVHLFDAATSLIPAIETVMDVSPSWRLVMREIYYLLAPVSWTPRASAWTGNPVVVESTLKTHVRIINFPPQIATKFLTLCRSNNATLTGALYTLAVSVLSGIILSSENVSQKTISCLIPVSLRGAAGIPSDVFCDCVSTLSFHPPFQPHFSWAEAWKFTTVLRSSPKSGEVVGMLKYLFGNYVAFFKGKLGNKRQQSLELSNLGLFEGMEGRSQTSSGEWSIRDMAFAQCDSVVGPALKMCVVGSPAGGIGITVTWGEGSVENSIAESFVSGLERGIMVLLVWYVAVDMTWSGFTLFIICFIEARCMFKLQPLTLFCGVQ